LSSSGREEANVLTQPLDGCLPHQVMQLRGYALFSFDWSQDGKQLILKSRYSGA